MTDATNGGHTYIKVTCLDDGSYGRPQIQTINANIGDILIVENVSVSNIFNMTWQSGCYNTGYTIDTEWGTNAGKFLWTFICIDNNADGGTFDRWYPIE
jgi:hypothetical protein